MIVPALFIMASNSTMDTMDICKNSLPQTVENVLIESGAFENFTESDVEQLQKEREEEAKNPKPRRRYSLHALQRLLGLMPPKELEPAARWTEEEYRQHCLPKDAGPYDHLTEEDWVEYERHQEEAERNEPWCNYCHPQSGCDGDHGDEMRGGFLLRKGPAVSPITVPQEQAQPICRPTLKCSWPEFCRCGWQFLPCAEIAQFRGGTAKWDPASEFWTWTSTSTTYSSTWSMHFPLEEQPEVQPEAQPEQELHDYIEEVDAWARDVERLIAESKAIREAPLSAFADLAALEDDTIPEVDIDAL